MKSALENGTVVDEYLEKEVRLGRVFGPLEESVLPTAHVNGFGIIPKSHQPGKYRLIVDLPHTRGASINDGIEWELCSMKYTSMDEVVRAVVALGPGAQMAKFDIESAYRLILVHQDELIGQCWA